MGIEDYICFQPCGRVSKHELLHQLTVFVNILCSFDLNIPDHSIVLRLETVSKMQTFFYPGKRISAKINVWKSPFFLEESITFSFAF